MQLNDSAVGTIGTRGIAVTEQTEQQERITLPLARLRWLQEMGVAPALLRPYAPGRVAPARASQATVAGPDATDQTHPTDQQGSAHEGTNQQGAGRAMFEEMLRSMERPPQAESKRSTKPPVGVQKNTRSQPLSAPKQKEVRPESATASEQQDKTNESIPSAPQVPSAAPAPVQVTEQQDSFTQWRDDLSACEACARCDERAVVLPGVGVRDTPDWFVLGGMPTRQDEGAGRVWSASAGRLLAAQLRSVGLNLRQQVYLSYALKCRSNQPQASPESITACRENFLQELSWVQPKRLLLLGAEAVQMLWGAQARLEDLRGALQYWTDPKGRELPVVVTVDPTTLLLRPQQKARAWHDLLVLQQVMVKQAETN
ncbi:MAG TPA: uracil-DNA glycosylase family protein [Paenalcaligenes sp.]|nr:uracil-DNA glycosylase family protein [Paenalcaligenes sp.]